MENLEKTPESIESILQNIRPMYSYDEEYGFIIYGWIVRLPNGVYIARTWKSEVIDSIKKFWYSNE